MKRHTPLWLNITLMLITCIFSACQPIEAPLEERLMVHIKKDQKRAENDQSPGLLSEPAAPSAKKKKITQPPAPPNGPLKSFAAPESYKRPAMTKQSHFGEELVTVAVDKMPLEEFIHYSFAEILETNYVLDGQLKEKTLAVPVTMNLSKEISKQHFFELVIDHLNQHKIAVTLKNEIYYLQKGTTEQEEAFGFGRNIDDLPGVFGKVKQLVPIKYIQTSDLTRLLQTAGVKVEVSTNENMITLRGSRDRVERAMSMIQALDRPAMRSRYVEMLPIKYAKPKELRSKIIEFLGQEGVPLAKSAGRSGLYISELGYPKALLLFSAEQEWLDRAKYWAGLIDIAPRRSPPPAQKQYFLYYPRNSKALDLKKTLGDILSLKPPEATSEGTPAKKTSKGKKGKKDTVSTSFKGEDIGIAVDERNNTIIIYSTERKFKEIESLLKKLDIMPAQVLIEATLAEITLTDALQYGLEWYLENHTGSNTNIIQTLGLGLGSGGLDISLISNSEDFQVLLNALAQEELVKLLSNPRLMVQDGSGASFVVGTEVPTLISEAQSGDTTTIQSIQYRSTGTQLTVTPTVQASGVITLKISLEISEAQANNTSEISSPIILNRSINTEVVASEGQTILMAGFIKENQSGGIGKVPYLGDIPVLGHLFRTDSVGSDRTELAIMLKAHIIQSTQHHDELLEALLEGFDYIDMEEPLEMQSGGTVAPLLPD